MEERELEIIKPLIVPNRITKEKLKELVEKAKPFISIEEETGRVIINKSKVPNWVKIGLLLLGKYFAEVGGLTKTSLLTMREISSSLNLPITTVPAPLKKLIKKGYVEKVNEFYKIHPIQIEKFLGELIEKYGEEK